MKISVTRSIDVAEAAAIRSRLKGYEAVRKAGDAPAGSRLAQLNAAVVTAPERVALLQERADRLREALADSEAALAAAEAGDAFLEIATRQAEAAAIRERLAAVEAEAVKARDQATAALEQREHAWMLICNARSALTAIASDSSAFIPGSIEHRKRAAWSTLEDLLDPIADASAAA